MYITSPLSPKDYRNAIKGSISNFSNLYSERFTGYFIGKLFSITHHCEHEFGSRNTPACAAVGYIKESKSGSEMYFVCLRGLFRPLAFFITLCICIFISLLLPDIHPYPFAHIAVGIGIAVLYAGFHTIWQYGSKRDQESYDALMALMDDPIAPYRDE